MTTIICDGRFMIGDGYITSNGTMLSDNCIKVHELKDGRIIGFGGNTYNWKEVLDYYDGSRSEWPYCSDDFTALLMDTNGRVYSIDEKGRSWERPVPAAVGSGRSFALGALDAGADIESAMKAACKRDIYSGGIPTKLQRHVI